MKSLSSPSSRACCLQDLPPGGVREPKATVMEADEWGRNLLLIPVITLQISIISQLIWQSVLSNYVLPVLYVLPNMPRVLNPIPGRDPVGTLESKWACALHISNRQ
jgi:hypothetical protein